MPRKILVPLDGSRFAEAALPLALTLCRRAEAPLHLVTVREPLPSFAQDGREEEATAWAEEYLEDVVARIGDAAGGPVHTSLKAGTVVEELRAEAREEEADLVVMATHGRGVLSRAWLGSVADGFVRQARRPVLLVRPDHHRIEDFAAEAPHLRSILVPLDGSEAAEEALEEAEELGRLFDARYHLVRVSTRPLSDARPYLPHTHPPAGVGDAESRDDEATRYVEEVAERMRARGLEVETQVLPGVQPGHAILEAAAEAGSDLIAMATHGRKGLTRALLGSTADKVLRGTQVPVLLHRRGEREA